MNRTTLAITLIAASATGLGIATANAASPGVPATPQVLTILPHPPFEMRINGKLTGFDVQLANAVAKAGGIPPYAETQQYVTHVIDFYRQYRSTRDTVRASLGY